MGLRSNPRTHFVLPLDFLQDCFIGGISPQAGSQIETAVVDFKPVQPELVLVGKVAYGEDRYSKISSPLQGRVVEVRARLGDRVEAGATLLVIDSSDITAAYSEFVKEASELEYSTRAQELAKELHATKALALKDLKQAENDLIKARANSGGRRNDCCRCEFRHLSWTSRWRNNASPRALR